MHGLRRLVLDLTEQTLTSKPPDYYASLRAQAGSARRDSLDDGPVNAQRKQIELDLHRTFPHNKFFGVRLALAHTFADLY